METVEATFKQFPKLFQVDILTALAQDKQFLRESIGLLKPEYFEKRLHLLLAQGIYKIYLATKQMPGKSSLLHSMSEDLMKEVKIKDEHQKKTLILEPVQKLLKQVYREGATGLKYVKKETMNFCRVQELKRSFLEGYEELEKDADPEKAKEFIAKRIRRIHSLEHGGMTFFKDIDSLHGQLYRDRTRCATTGFKSLDKWMGGGMDPGTETVFMAPAKFGKSMILVNVGFNNLLRGKIVVHFTLEISEPKIARRYACRISRTGNIEKYPKRTANRVKKFCSMHRGRLFIKGYPTKSASVETLKSYLYHLQNQKDIKPDLIIVDYGDILRSASYSRDKDGGGERFVQGDVFEGLRAMAQEFDCSLVTATQCNRAAASKPLIHMEDVAEGYVKCQIADHIIAVCGTDEERRAKRLRLFFAGSREAETHRQVRIEFNWKKAMMKEIGEFMEEEKKKED